MKFTRLPAAIATLLFLIAFVTAGCGPAQDPLAGKSIIHRALSSEPESLDPQKGRSVQAADVLRDIGEGLAGYTAGGDLVAAAAESWEIADDGLTYTFHIRPDARWSNGDRVVAADLSPG